MRSGEVEGLRGGAALVDPSLDGWPGVALRWGAGGERPARAGEGKRSFYVCDSIESGEGVVYLWRCLNTFK